MFIQPSHFNFGLMQKPWISDCFKTWPDLMVTIVAFIAWRKRERRYLDRQAYFLDDGQHDKPHFYPDPPLFIRS